MTPAETLRAAAQRVREVAGKATPGPWSSIGVHSWSEVKAPDGHTVASICDCPDHVSRRYHDTCWIATMSPAIAEPLAIWLESAPDYDQRPLAVARAILGGER